MNIGLVIGKKNSVGIPGKNLRKILGRPSAEYAFIAAKYAKLDQIFVSTDCNKIIRIAKKYNSKIINRPRKLCMPDSLTEDVLVHAYKEIGKVEDIKKIKSITLLFCNNPAIDVLKLNKAIKFINNTKYFDSCFSVANYDMFSPIRARTLDKKKTIKPFTDLKNFKFKYSSIRGKGRKAYFCDFSIQVMKKICFEKMNEGNPPCKWQGKRSKAIFVDYGFDVDADWQFVVIEHWLKQKGFTEKKYLGKKNK